MIIGRHHKNLFTILNQPLAICLHIIFSISLVYPNDLVNENLKESFIRTYCYECHDSEINEGGVNFESLSPNLNNRSAFNTWVRVFDKVSNGLMPPQKSDQPSKIEREAFLSSLGIQLKSADIKYKSSFGRHGMRRLNRFEYENKIRDLLSAPWLIVADNLPEDPIVHHFTKTSSRLDISHVQMQKYFEVANQILTTILNSVAHKPKTQKFYAREEKSFNGFLRYYWAQSAATRAIVPLIGTVPEPEVIRGNKPLTVGASDPIIREQESMGVFSGTYQATTKYDFTKVNVPIDGHYRINIKSYSFTAGPNGRSGGDDNGLTGGREAWWRPSRTVAFKSKRSEPVTIYSLGPSGDSRWLCAFDTQPDPSISSHLVTLKKGEKIRPDATRLVRTRPGWKGNPNATEEGVPGVAFNWLEIEGPIYNSWPPESFQKVFGNTPYEVTDKNEVELQISRDDSHLPRQIFSQFLTIINNGIPPERESIEKYLRIYSKALEYDLSPSNALIQSLSAALCSPDFLFIYIDDERREDQFPADKLSYFLWNSPPDPALIDADLDDPHILSKQIGRMVEDHKFKRFINSFLDYWLDLRDINANTPDAELYPDYYLDELLTESSLIETRAFFEHLIKNNLSASHIIHSEFSFINERLAEHYNLPHVEGIKPILTQLPGDSQYGGLLTQASLMRITANGTTTSPVIRGAWIMERLLGLDIPPPPSGVEAIEPDTRGATSIKDQLEKHSNFKSCKNCHQNFDPVGFALESFDVAGGWRQKYRAINQDFTGKPVKGFGKNGHAFKFHHGMKVDSSGSVGGTFRFNDVRGLKKHFLKSPRTIAKNLLKQFIIYSTGEPVSFSERDEVDSILDKIEPENFPIKDMILELCKSQIFRSI